MRNEACYYGSPAENVRAMTSNHSMPAPHWSHLRGNADTYCRGHITILIKNEENQRKSYHIYIASEGEEREILQYRINRQYISASEMYNYDVK